MNKNFKSKELEYFLDLLKTAKNEVSIESYIYIKNILNSIEFPIPITIYPKGTKFVRNRVHQENIFFKNVDQLSYRKDIQNIKTFGRANEPGQSVFYCSDNDILSFVETSHVARELKDKDFEYLTTGIWIATENIVMVSLLTNDDIRGQHSEIDESSKSFENLIATQNDESGFAVKGLFEFLSKEFSQAAGGDSNHYKITAAFTNYIFDSVKVADGILYPSTIYPTKGFNFAFKPEVVDTKMQFYAAQRIKMQNMGNKKYFETEKIESIIHKTKSDSIQWKK
jgi:hypothetical protein